MPTVLKFLSYRVVIHTNDHRPCHVHVYPKAGGVAEFWLDCPGGPPHPKLISKGIPKVVALRIQKHLAEHLAELCAAWRKIHVDYR